jgi:hypothetical protein
MKSKNQLFYLKTLAFAVVSATITSCSTSENATSETTDDSSVNNFLMIATGQTVAYDDDGEVLTDLEEGDAFYGQDATYLKGKTMSYTDNGDSTVTDNNTGLMWQQSPAADGLSWDEAVEYCENLELGGYTDWRMPSCKELYSISDFESGWPYINLDYFDLAVEVSKDEQYWASDYYVGVTVEGGSNAAFGVNHVTGHIKAYAATVSGQFGNYVRAVRGDEYGTNAYVDNGDSTVTDSNTGLMWAQDDSGEGLDWEDALAYAENSELAGYTDWRLPNIKELQGIVDYTKSPTATDSANLGAAIDDIFNISVYTGDDSNTEVDYPYFWSSTSSYFSTSSPGYYYAWYVAFGTAVNDDGDDFHGAGAVRFDTKDIDGPAAEEAERYYNYARLVRDAN